MGAKRGMDAKLYYKEGGVQADGSWAELTNVRDLTLGMEKGEADVSTRGNNGWRARLSTLKDGTVEFQMVWDPSDAGFEAIHDAYMNNNKIGLKILDDVEATGTGLRADFEIFNFSRNEPLEEGVTVDVTAKITYSSYAPEWIEQGAIPTGTATY